MKCEFVKYNCYPLHLSAQKDVSVCNFENVRAIMSVSYKYLIKIK